MMGKKRLKQDSTAEEMTWVFLKPVEGDGPSPEDDICSCYSHNSKNSMA